jgi:hypothetical protein
MCGKMGHDEVDSMQNMMAMSAYFVIADALDIDAMDLDGEQDLEKDFHLTDNERQQLSESISDMFNGLELDFSRIHQVKDIVDQVISQNNEVLH